MESSSLENQNHQQILDNCLTEIGLILSSNRDFNQVYHQFTAQVKRLVEFDHIYVNVIHREAGLTERKYDAGLSLPHRSIPDFVPLGGENRTNIVVTTGQPLISEYNDTVALRFPGDRAFIEAGLRSIIVLPLIYMGKVIGTLGLRSREVRAYGPQEQQILEHLANTIAPAIENAELDDQRSSAETRLRIAEDNYRNVFAYGAVGIYQATPGGIIRSVNSALVQMCGYESPEHLMANVTDFRRQLPVDPNERPETRRLVDEHGSSSGLEQRILGKDGIAIWVSATFRSVRNDNGSLLCYEGFLLDITDRKQAKQAILESEQRYRSLMENAADAIFLMDRQLMLVDINSAGCQLSGYTSTDLLAMAGYELLEGLTSERLPRQGIR